MFKKFIEKFLLLPKSNKSMVYLMWIQSIWSLISSIFINIYVFSINKDFIDVIYYNMFFLSSIFIGFSFIWYIMSLLKKNIKNMYYFAYILYIIAFLSIFIFKWYFAIFSFAIIFWLWYWMFWCAVHSQELINIEDKNRDAYSSIISSWRNIINIVMPILIAILFFLVRKFTDINPYNILFLFLPLVYLLSFLFIKDIWDYIPNKPQKKDFINFFNLKKYLFWQLYFLSVWIYQRVFWVITPIIAIIILKNEVNVWLFEWIISIMSTFLIISLINKRNTKNRLKIMLILSILTFINLIIFYFNFNIFWYIFFTLVWLFLNPLYRVSEHVFDLKLMDTIKAKWSDFFSAMILREFSLWIWRICVIILFIFILKTWIETENILKTWLLIWWSFILFAWFSVYLHIKKENNEDIIE